MNTTISHISMNPSWPWSIFSIGIIILLIIDLSLFKKGNKKNQIKIALLESSAWVLLALIFNLWITLNYGTDLGLQFLTGYLVEKSLSIDNLFIILLIFGSFKIPQKYQHKILFYGVIGAILMRGIFILIGAQLIHHFHWILYIFGLILIITAIKLLKETDKTIDTKESWPIKIIKKIIPTTDKISDDSFFVKENKVLKATPLFLALLIIEITDLIFAVDSIPAVFSITQDAFIAFSSNIFALLGLRALYFVLADWVATLRYLRPGLSAILGFIGLKMLLADVVSIPAQISLVVICTILVTAAISSWYVTKIRSNGQDLKNITRIRRS